MTLTGLEAPIAKSALSGIQRLYPYLWQRYRQRSMLQGAQPQIALARPQLPDLEASAAAGLDLYVHSPDFNIIAAQITFQTFDRLKGRRSLLPANVVKSQLREGLRYATGMQGGDLATLVDAIESRLSERITIIVSDYAHDLVVPAAVFAQLASGIADQAAAALRNSELLSRTRDLAEYHTFERILREQIATVQAKIRVPNAIALKTASYENLYVEPSLYLAVSAHSAVTNIRGRSLITVIPRAVILGDPGGGKSTLAARTIYDVATGTGPDNNLKVPFLMVLREYIEDFRSKRTTILDYLEQLCRSPYQVVPPTDAVEYLLLNGRAMVIFDGLDEIVDTELRARAVEAIEAFGHLFPNAPIIVTSRKVGYEEAPFDPAAFPTVELRQFDESQITEYAHNWFRLGQGHVDRSYALAQAFMRDSVLVNDLRVNPLMLSLMCSMYANEGYIPANRPDVYEKCSLMLFEQWDKQRGINRVLPFDAHVRSAIQSLAWWLYTEPSNDAGLTRSRLLAFMTAYLHRERFANLADAENAAEAFIQFCTGRAWVLTKFGLAKEQEVFGFVHRTFLEYFAASQMVRMFPDASRLFDELEGRLVLAEWDEMAQLSLQALNRSVEHGASNFLQLAIAAVGGRSEIRERSNLLSFMVRSLGFVVPDPQTIKGIVGLAVESTLDLPGVDGGVPDRFLQLPGVLYRYDLPWNSLRECGMEVRDEIASLIVQRISAELAKPDVGDNWRLACEEARFFLGWIFDLVGAAKSWSDLMYRYNKSLLSRPFWRHDANDVLRGELPVVDLLTRYGVGVAYRDVVLADLLGSYAVDSNFCCKLLELSAPSELALEVSNALLGLPLPWIGRPDVQLENVRMRSPSQVDSATVAGAFVMLLLPLLELRSDSFSAIGLDVSNAGSVRLGRLIEECARYRHLTGHVNSSDLKEIIYSSTAPDEVSDFLFKWATRNVAVTGVPR